VNALQDDADRLRHDFGAVHLAGQRRDRQSVFSQTLDLNGYGFPAFRLEASS
jgi:hypothetical protein